MAGIESVSVYVPGGRLDAPLAEALASPATTRLASVDEDSLTLAWQALQGLESGEPISALNLRVNGQGVEPRALAAHLAAVGCVTADVTTVALAPDAGGVTALRMPGDDDRSVTVVVDHGPPHDHATAPSPDLAIAWRAGTPRAAEVVTSVSAPTLSFDRWATTAVSGPADPRFVEETLIRHDASALLRRLLSTAGVMPAQLAGVVVSATVAPRAARWAREWGVANVWTPSTPEFAPGRHAAQTLAEAFSRLRAAGPGALVAVLEMGWGGDAVLLRAGADVEDAVSTTARHPGGAMGLGHWLRTAGAPPSDTIWTAPAKLRREAAPLLGLVGSRCEDCGLVAFPVRLACEGCTSTRLVSTPLSRTGTVVSHNLDRLFAAPDREIQMIVLDLDGGGRFFGQSVADARRWAEVGDRAHLTLRRLHQGSGLPHYFWKVDLDD